MALSTISGTTGITDATITSAKLADFAAAVDLNGVELILDADQDTSITADTDDRIDLKIGGAEHISFGNSSGDTIIKVMADSKDIVFQQYDGNKILEINDGNYVAISGAAAGPGELRFYEDTDLGSHYTGFKAGNATASLSYVLPLADGTDGYQLTTDGSGTLSWAAAGVTLSGSTNNTIATVTGASALAGEANLTFDGSVLAVTGNVTATGTVEPAGDTAASDNAAIGYTAAEGLILTGQGSTNDVTIKNDADADVMSIPTGTTGVTFAGTVGSGAITSTGIVTGTGFTAGSAVLAEAELELLDGLTAGTAIASKVVTTDASIDTTGQRNLTITGVMTGATIEATGDTAAGDNAAMGYTAAEGLILTGQGSTSDITIKNDADATVLSVATGTTTATFAGTVLAKTDTDTSNTGSITLDFTANQNFVLTLTGNVTLANPSTEQVGQSGFIAFIQDGTGSRTVTLGTDYETAGAAGLTLTSTASATDLVPYLVVASNRILLGTPQLAFA